MRKLLCLSLAALVCAVSHAAPAPDSGQTRLLRFPTTDGSQIVFSYAGQLYTVGVEGGVARRLTDSPGYAIFPRFSPDGKWLAFDAQYDGNTEAYVMPASGGAPKRISYSATLDRDDLSDRMGPNNIVMTWKNTKPEIVFRSRWRTFDPFVGQLVSASLEGDLPTRLPVPRGGWVSFSPDDSKMAYNRVFREFRTWKRYRGGQADDIWIFDFKTGALENITNNDAQDIFPMWAPNGKIYFASDRDGHMNLFSYELSSKKTTQLTSYKDYDLKFPSLGTGGIVFEQAGYLWFFDLKTEQARQVPITIHEDFAPARPALINISKFVSTVHASPDGKRAVVVARGEVFTVPQKSGQVRNLTQTSGVHERDAFWSPDGRWIAYVSDATGENELYIRAQDGHEPAVQITSGADTYYYKAIWSPDSKKLLWGDRAQRLRFVDTDSKTVTVIDETRSGEFTQYNWSPDSKWVAYTHPENGTPNKVMLYSVDDKKSTEVTDGWYDSGDPAFSDDGRFLLISSSRDFNPTYSATEWNHAYKDMQRVYLVALAKATESPLKPKDDEVETAEDDKKASDEKASSEKKDASAADAGAKNTDKDKPEKPKPVVVKIDLDGLKDRLIGLPIKASIYSLIRMVDDKIYYRRGDGENDGESPPPEEKSMLLFYDLKERKETELGNFDDFEITADGKKMLVKQDKDYAIIDLPTAKIEIKDKLNLSGLEMNLDRQAEWTQIYNECWRQMRDFFYAPGMHGLDWPAMREKYAALLPSVRSRNDLTYVIGELIGELNIGHAYVGGGDRSEAPRLKMGLLGADFSRDPASRAYKIEKILRGQNWQDNTRSPLTEIGVDVKEGDYILAINGKLTRDLVNLYQALVNTAGEQVVLTVNSSPKSEGARQITVVPIADEAPLYYYNWVEHNIAYVAEKTGGKVGYLHIPDMGPDGLNEFAKHFYPQLRKKALIIDVRGNGGGNVSPMIIERLRRELAMVEIERNGEPHTNPPDMLLGPMVTLLDEFSASDGDIFPYRFKTYGLGKLVGKRSWGGVVGIRESLPLTDGGFLTKPEFAPYAKDGSAWVIEGHGVDPDVYVDNDPAKEFAGVDQQLDKAIEVILDELKTKAKDLPPPPPYPVKTTPR